MTDEGWKAVGVCLTQPEPARVLGTVYGDADVDRVKHQVARILSLDVDGRDWPAVGKRDRVIARLQQMFPGFGP